MNQEFTDPIDSQLISQNLKSAWLGKVVHYFPELTSTNDRLKEHAAAGAKTGTLVLTDYQSKGRGRLSRTWTAPAGSSLLFSLLFRPDWPIERANWLVMMAGLAASKSIEDVVGLSVQLKWPNDLVIDISGKRHKVGGILMDLVTADGDISAAVVGVGINVNTQRPEIPGAAMPAASLRDAVGHPISRLLLLTRLLELLEDLYETAQQGQSPQPEWEKSLITIGSQVSISSPNGGPDVTGLALGTDNSGRLIVRDSSSVIHMISAGDVTIRD